MDTSCKEIGELPFDPQPLRMATWRPEDEDVRGIIAGFHGLGSRVERAFYYLGPFMAKHGWITLGVDMPGFGHWVPREKRAMKRHWQLQPLAMRAVLEKCMEVCPRRPLVMLGSSLGGLNIVDFLLHQERPNGIDISAVVALVPAIGKFNLPWYLYLAAGIVMAVYPGARINIKKFLDDMKSNDPDSIILEEDPVGLDRISMGLLFEIFKTNRKAGNAQHGYEKWDNTIPIMLVSAGLDTFVMSDQVREFHDGLPLGTRKRYINYEQNHHGVLYELNREELFGEILSFIENSN